MLDYCTYCRHTLLNANLELSGLTQPCTVCCSARCLARVARLMPHAFLSSWDTCSSIPLSDKFSRSFHPR
jgi:hypothetical protein